MSNNKQSSIEQFAIALYDNGLLQGNGNHIDDLLLHFKAMHKEEIEDAYISNSMIRTRSKAEDYYNETFNPKGK